MKNPTLSDVALAAGVSRTTASYVLNGRSDAMRISVAAQQRVHHAVDQLGYRPNRSAQSLRTSLTQTIGLISDLVASGAFASRMLTGASAAAREADHLLVIGETEGDRVLEEHLIDEMADRQVDGLVYATLTATRVRVPARLRGRPVVLLNCFDPDHRFPTVMPDDRGGGRMAARLLVDRGLADRVVVVGLDPNPAAVAGVRRLEGVTSELAAAGLELGGHLACDWRVRDAYAAVRTWLAEGGYATALVCLNDRIAMGAYQAAAKLGLRIPEDLAVVSFDGSDLATWLRPTLTSVALPFAELGARAVRLLMSGELDPPVEIEVPMPVLEGESAAGRDPQVSETGGT